MTISRKQYMKTYHQFLNIFHITSAHVLIIFSFYVFHIISFPIFFTILFLILCSIIHQKYMSEWVHESAHINIMINKRKNDLFTNIFISVIFGTSITKHRHGHLIHHKIKNFFYDNDPDTRFLMVKTKRNLKLSLFQDILGITALKMILFDRSVISPKSKLKKNSFTRSRWPILSSFYKGLI
jgi:hypothetical protein